MPGPVSRTRRQPAEREVGRPLNVTLLKGQNANFAESAEIAKARGARLIETGDLNLMSREQLTELRDAVKEKGWFWFGDKRGLDQKEARRLKEKLESIFGERVDGYPGTGRLAFGSDQAGGYSEWLDINALEDETGIHRAPMVVLVFEKAA